MPYIHFDHVNKYFGQNHVLKDISLEIEQGELVTFLGPSGCGKSTLLRCLSGLEAVTDGKIYLDGKDITDLEPKRRGVGTIQSVPQFDSGAECCVWTENSKEE